MKFWNREREIEYLKRYIQTEPNAILFVYGPKSSGKSTLLMKVVEKLSRRKRFLNWYKIYWFDLRGKFIANYENVVDLFFVKEEVAERILERERTVKTNLFPFITVEAKDKELMKKREMDPFEYMEGILRKNKRNVIVFDELQKLKGIYMNGQRELVNELFNFFVRLTKVLHLSHVIVMTSDTFFIERVYTDSTLKNTSRFYLVDFFDDDTALEILRKKFSEDVSKEIVEWIGGVPWMLEEVIDSEDPKQTIKELYKETLSKMYEILKRRDDLKKVLKKAVEGENLFFDEEDEEKIRELVEKEILFYDPVNMLVKFQTKLDERAAKKILGVGR